MTKEFIDITSLAGKEFNDEGFLAPESRKRFQVYITQQLEKEFFLARKLNRLAHKEKFNLHFESNSLQHVLIAPLIVRQLNTYSAIIMLLESGLSSEAATLTRVSFENTVYIKLFSLSADQCIKFTQSDDYDRLQILKNVEPVSGPLNEAQTLALKELRQKYPKKRILRDDAKAAGLEKQYNELYRYHSGLAAHPTPRALESLISVENGSLNEIFFLPKNLKLHHTLQIASRQLAYSFKTALEFLNKSSSSFDDIVVEFDALPITFDHLPPSHPNQMSGDFNSDDI